MGGNSSPICRLPNPSPSLLHSLSHNSHIPATFLDHPFFHLHLHWIAISCCRHDVYIWAYVPPCLNLFSTRCNPVGLQCNLLLFHQLPEANSFYIQLCGPPHLLSLSPRSPIWLHQPQKNPHRRVCNWVPLYRGCFCSVLPLALTHSVCISEGPKEGDLCSGPWNLNIPSSYSHMWWPSGPFC